MEDLILTWDDPETKEEFMLHCRCTAQGLQVEVKRRLAGSILLDVPPEFASDLAEWFEGVRKKVDQHSRRIGI